jgi:hypothetical protein
MARLDLIRDKEIAHLKDRMSLWTFNILLGC